MNLHELVKEDAIDALKKFLEINQDINITSDYLKNTPLHIAAIEGHVKATQLLLQAGADTKIFNERGFLPSHLAVTYNHPDILELFLSYDKGLLKRADRQGNTMLHIAVSKRHVELVQYLFKKGASTNITNAEGNTVFHQAVAWNCPYILRLLLLHSNTHVNVANNQGYAPIHLAAMKNLKECIQVLLMFGANSYKQDRYGKTADTYGSDHTQKIFAKYKLFKEVKTIFSSGMSSLLTSRRYIDNASPLHLIAMFSDERMLVHQCVASGADVNAKDELQNTPLKYALQCSSIHNIRALINAGADSRLLNIENNLTPLHLAIQRHDLELVDFLLKHHAKVNATDKTGETPLLYAVVQHFRKGVQLLIENGAKIAQTDQNGNTPLHLSVTANNITITMDLLEKGKETINSMNYHGHTPLMCSILGRNAKLTKLLLTYGGDLHVRDKNGKSALEMAFDTKCDALIKIFAEHQAEN